MSKTIAIIELYQHDEVLRHYCEMFGDSDYNINFFCSKTVYRNLEDYTKYHRMEWKIKEDHTSIPAFLKANSSLIQSADLVFITTALSHFKAFHELSKSVKTLLLVHNAHSFLAPSNYLYFKNPLADRLRALKTGLNRSHYHKRKMLEHLAGLVFPTETVLNYVKAHFDIPAQLKLMSLPFAYFMEKPKRPAPKTTIVIPCTVHSALRDYKTVLQVFSEIRDQLEESICLVLLGRPKGEGGKIIEAFRKLNGRKIEVITFNDFVPVKDYEQWLRSADFLILPLRAFAQNYIYQERLGYSKISGGVNDMIRFGIPAIVSSAYPLNDQLKEITRPYDSKETLSRLVSNWIRETGIPAAGIQQALSDYRKPVLKQQFDKKIEGLF